MNKINNLISLVKDNMKMVKIGAVIIIIIIAALLVFVKKGEEYTIQIPSDEGTQTEENKSTDQSQVQTSSKNICIDIGGNVKKPGVYEVKDGSRVYQVIEKAGGLSKDADTTNINQAEKVTDGQKITIPSKKEIEDSNVTSASSSEASSENDYSNNDNSIININTADSDKLQEISGVGPATAEKIINYRTNNGSFKKIEDIKNVSGIGEKTFEKIKDKITV